MERCIARRLCAIVLAAGASSPLFADFCLAYDADLGSLPTAQGWQIVAVGERALSYGVEEGALHQSSLPFANPTCPGPPQESQYLYWWADEPFLFNDGVVFEVRVRVIASEYVVNPCSGWARPGFACFLNDTAGGFFWVGLGESMIFLANSPYLSAGEPGFTQAPFDTTDGFHLYRLEVCGGSATLRIDGAPILTMESGGVPVGPGALVYIGDPTTWANSEVLVQEFSLSRGACCPADLDGDGMVGGADLGQLLGGWGQAGTGDLDGSGAVDGADLGALLGMWGPCPSRCP